MTVLVTGATGFVGRVLVQRLLRTAADAAASAANASGPVIRACTRSGNAVFPEGVESVVIPDIAGVNEWTPMLPDVQAVVHLAARVHHMHESQAEASVMYDRVNVDATLRLARDAARSGVRRFVFVSSVKVLGECTPPNVPFTDSSAVASCADAYATSKLRAERALTALAAESGMELVIVRAPLVYGPGVGANFLALVQLVSRGVPLPFAGIHNRRSLIAVENLADFLAHCTTHVKAANQTFVISDGDDVSTPTLVRRIASAFGTDIRLFSIPPQLLLKAASVIGKGPAVRRLVESLQLDSNRARSLLDWTPPLSMDEQLRRMAVAGRASDSAHRLHHQ